MRTAAATGAVVERIRREVPFLEGDRFLAPYLRVVEELVRTDELARTARDVLGILE